MKARTHDLAAIVGLSLVVIAQPTLPTMSLATVLMALLANQLGGIAPDIDQPTAPFWRNLPVGGLFGRLISRMMGGHRFITHSIIGVAAAGFLVNLLLAFLHPIMPNIQTDIVWWAFMIGMVSHLIMDSFTKEGVPWLLPLPIKFGLPPLRKFRITTGKWVENFVVLPLLLLLGIFVAYRYYPEIYALVHLHVTK